MPLQNRVDPFGRIHAVAERGMFTGNRGVIHDPQTRTLLSRRWATRAWLICRCDYKGVRRVPMGRNTRSGGAGWTELFFLDEVTALAAGHRPCFFCRSEQARSFATCFGLALGMPTPRAPDMDARLHRERLAAGAVARELSRADLARLPDGAMFADGVCAYAVRAGSALPWSFRGYGKPLALTGLAGSALRALTPAATVEVLRAGYEPAWHSSAKD